MTVYTAWAARSITGIVRQGNEDAAYAGRWLHAIADGMGGHVAGEVASAAVITSMSRHDEAVPGGRLVDVLADAVTEANAELARQVDADPALRTMSTTLTAMLWAGRAFALAHIGDSRAYLARGGQLRQLTTDHSLANLVANAGGSIMAPFMTRYLDGRADRGADLGLHQAEPGDRYLLCTDGLSGVIPAAELRQGMTADDSPDTRAGWLAGRALAHGAPDNVTVIVIDVTAEPAGRPAAPALLGAAAPPSRALTR